MGCVDVNAVEVGQCPVCSDERSSGRKPLRFICSSMSAVKPSLICGALASVDSGQSNVGNLLGRRT